MTGRPVSRRALALLGPVVVGVGLVPSSTAWAHASLESTTPVANAVLEAGPTSIVLDFDEDVEAALSSVSLYGTGGVEVPVGDAVSGEIGRAHV